MNFLSADKSWEILHSSLAAINTKVPTHEQPLHLRNAVIGLDIHCKAYYNCRVGLKHHHPPNFYQRDFFYHGLFVKSFLTLQNDFNETWKGGKWFEANMTQQGILEWKLLLLKTIKIFRLKCPFFTGCTNVIRSKCHCRSALTNFAISYFAPSPSRFLLPMLHFPTQVNQSWNWGPYN